MRSKPIRFSQYINGKNGEYVYLMADGSFKYDPNAEKWNRDVVSVSLYKRVGDGAPVLLTDSGYFYTRSFNGGTSNLIKWPDEGTIRVYHTIGTTSLNEPMVVTLYNSDQTDKILIDIEVIGVTYDGKTGDDAVYNYLTLTNDSDTIAIKNDGTAIQTGDFITKTSVFAFQNTTSQELTTNNLSITPPTGWTEYNSSTEEGHYSYKDNGDGIELTICAVPEGVSDGQKYIFTFTWQEEQGTETSISVSKDFTILIKKSDADYDLYIPKTVFNLSTETFSLTPEVHKRADTSVENILGPKDNIKIYASVALSKEQSEPGDRGYEWPSSGSGDNAVWSTVSEINQPFEISLYVNEVKWDAETIEFVKDGDSAIAYELLLSPSVISPSATTQTISFLPRRIDGKDISSITLDGTNARVVEKDTEISLSNYEVLSNSTANVTFWLQIKIDGEWFTVAENTLSIVADGINAVSYDLDMSNDLEIVAKQGDTYFGTGKISSPETTYYATTTFTAYKNGVQQKLIKETKDEKTQNFTPSSSSGIYMVESGDSIIVYITEAPDIAGKDYNFTWKYGSSNNEKITKTFKVRAIESDVDYELVPTITSFNKSDGNAEVSFSVKKRGANGVSEINNGSVDKEGLAIYQGSEISPIEGWNNFELMDTTSFILKKGDVVWDTETIQAVSNGELYILDTDNDLDLVSQTSTGKWLTNTELGFVQATFSAKKNGENYPLYIEKPIINEQEKTISLYGDLSQLRNELNEISKGVPRIYEYTTADKDNSYLMNLTKGDIAFVEFCILPEDKGFDGTVDNDVATGFTKEDYVDSIYMWYEVDSNDDTQISGYFLYGQYFSNQAKQYITNNLTTYSPNFKSEDIVILKQNIDADGNVDGTVIMYTIDAPITEGKHYKGILDLPNDVSTEKSFFVKKQISEIDYELIPSRRSYNDNDINNSMTGVRFTIRKLAENGMEDITTWGGLNNEGLAIFKNNSSIYSPGYDDSNPITDSVNPGSNSPDNVTFTLKSKDETITWDTETISYTPSGLPGTLYQVIPDTKVLHRKQENEAELITGNVTFSFYKTSGTKKENYTTSGMYWATYYDEGNDIIREHGQKFSDENNVTITGLVGYAETSTTTKKVSKIIFDFTEGNGEDTTLYTPLDTVVIEVTDDAQNTFVMYYYEGEESVSGGSLDIQPTKPDNACDYYSQSYVDEENKKYWSKQWQDVAIWKVEKLCTFAAYDSTDWNGPIRIKAKDGDSAVVDIDYQDIYDALDELTADDKANSGIYAIDGYIAINADIIKTGAIKVGNSSTPSENKFYADMNTGSAVYLAGWTVNKDSLQKSGVLINSSDDKKYWSLKNNYTSSVRIQVGSPTYTSNQQNYEEEGLDMHLNWDTEIDVDLNISDKSLYLTSINLEGVSLSYYTGESLESTEVISLSSNDYEVTITGPKSIKIKWSDLYPGENISVEKITAILKEHQTPPFLILEDGSLYASNAKISGVINAQSGKLGNWILSQNQIVNYGEPAVNNGDDKSSKPYLDVNGDPTDKKEDAARPDSFCMQVKHGTTQNAIAIGTVSGDAWGAAPFRVTHGGELLCTKGKIGKLLITENGLNGSNWCITENGMSLTNNGTINLGEVSYRSSDIISYGDSFTISSRNAPEHGSNVQLTLKGSDITLECVIKCSLKVTGTARNRPVTITASCFESDEAISSFKAEKDYEFTLRLQYYYNGQYYSTQNLQFKITKGQSSVSKDTNIYLGGRGSSDTHQLYITSLSDSGTNPFNLHKDYNNTVQSLRKTGVEFFSAYGQPIVETNATLYAKDFKTETYESDIRVKHSIEPFDSRYETFFDSMLPKRYKYIEGTSNRYHTGFIAQELEQALLSSNLTTQDFAGMCLDQPGTENERWYLRRDEFVALNTWQIQKLKPRMASAEEKLIAYESRISALEREIENLKNS